ncbi:Uncharacterised protein [Vibrio cholerae]|nr:Uncharacterised protein [Vibrio cholerae]
MAHLYARWPVSKPLPILLGHMDAMCSCLVSYAEKRFAQLVGELGHLHPDR